MVRPKKNTNELSAKDSLKEAFWTILSDKSYSDITIKALSAEAKVNPKTIYYYYPNIDTMAKELFKELQDKVDAKIILDNLFKQKSFDQLFKVQSNRIDFKHALLYTRGDSAYLISIFHDYVLNAWLEYAHLSRKDLSVAEYILT